MRPQLWTVVAQSFFNEKTTCAAAAVRNGNLFSVFFSGPIGESLATPFYALLAMHPS